MSSLQLVMLDFDGVLADSLDQYVAAHRATFERFSKTVPFTDFRSWYDSHWENNWLKGGFAYEELTEVVECCRALVDYRTVPLFPGIAEALRALQEKFSLVIVSTTPSEQIAAFLERHALSHLISRIYSPASGSAKGELIRRALADAEIMPERAVMVGDTAADILAGRNAGCRTAGVTYGWYTPKRIEQEAPDIIIAQSGRLAEGILHLAFVAG